MQFLYRHTAYKNGHKEKYEIQNVAFCKMLLRGAEKIAVQTHPQLKNWTWESHQQQTFQRQQADQIPQRQRGSEVITPFSVIQGNYFSY